MKSSLVKISAKTSSGFIFTDRQVSQILWKKNSENFDKNPQNSSHEN